MPRDQSGDGVDRSVRSAFDSDIVTFVDAFVDADGAAATEQHLQDRYGDDPDTYGKQQEALAYLRRAYEDELMTDTDTTDDRSNAHVGGLAAQLRLAKRDDDLPDEIAERHDLDDRGESA